MSKTRARRDNNSYSTIAKRSLPRYYYTPRVVTSQIGFQPRLNLFKGPSLRIYEDRRQWHPDRYPSARAFSQSRHRLTIGSIGTTVPSFQSLSKAVVAFARPNKILICVRRKIREEVMHALGKAGKGGQKRPRLTQYSSVSCKG